MHEICGDWFQTLERTVTQQKLQMDELKASIASLTKKAAQDKESLKKATRAQKLRAERFEAAAEKCYAELKEKVWGRNGLASCATITSHGLCFKFQETQLAKAQLETNSRRRQKEQVEEEREKLAAQIDLLKRSVA